MQSRYILGSAVFLYSLSLIILDNPIYTTHLKIINGLLIVSYVIFNQLTLKHQYKINYFIKQYSLLSIFALLSCVWAQNLDFSLAKSYTMILISANSFVIYNILRQDNLLEYLLAGIISGIAFNALVSVGIINIGWESTEGWRFQGTTVKSNILANICIFGTISSFYFYIKDNIYAKLFGLFGVLISVYVVILTASKKGILLSLCIIIIFFIFKKNKIRSIMTALLLVACLTILANYFNLLGIISSSNEQDIFYLFQKLEDRFNVFFQLLSNENNVDNSTRDRLLLLHKAIDAWLSSPLFGSGIGSFEYKHGAYAHNNFADLLANLGIFGLLVYYSLYWYILKRVIRLHKKNDVVILFTCFTIIMILMDFAIVSYTNKTIMNFLLVTFIILDREIKQFRLNTRQRRAPINPSKS